MFRKQLVWNKCGIRRFWRTVFQWLRQKKRKKISRKQINKKLTSRKCLSRFRKNISQHCSFVFWMNFFKIVSKLFVQCFCFVLFTSHKVRIKSIHQRIFGTTCYFGISFIWSDYYKFYNKVVSMLIKDWNGKNKSDSSVSYVFRHFKKTGMLANQNSWMPHNFMPRMAQLCFSAETSRSLQIHSTTNSLDTKYFHAVCFVNM